MTRANTATLNKKSAAGVALLPFLLLGGGAHAQDFTAGSIVNDMEPKSLIRSSLASLRDYPTRGLFATESRTA